MPAGRVWRDGATSDQKVPWEKFADERGGKPTTCTPLALELREACCGRVKMPFFENFGKF